MAEELNVETRMSTYKNFILRLRQLLGTSRQSFGVPHLVPRDDKNIQFFDFILLTNNNRVTFRLRRDNLYLIGYQMERDRWLEIGIENTHDPVPHLITGSTFLGFECGYTDLATAGGREVEGTDIGPLSLKSAVDNLATKADRRSRARWLVIVIMMICEATRLNDILDHMVKAISAPAIIKGWMLILVRNWSSFCEQVCRCDADPTITRLRKNDVRIPSDDGKKDKEVKTVYQATKVLGLSLHYCYRTDMTLDDDDDDCFVGLPLLEIFSVCMDNIAGENTGELYGTITVNDGLTQYIYNRTRDNSESIKPGQNVTLTGPQQSIWAQRSVIIKFLLKDKDTWSSDDEVINDSMSSWNAFIVDNKYDQPLSKQLNGTVTVNYAVLRNAVAATVTINLQEGGERTVQVYGQVVAKYKDWNYPNTTISLFNRPKDDYVDVKRRQNIPLLKSVVAVPLGSSLEITASLYDHDVFSGDDKIAIGNVEFPAKLSGTSSANINGEDGNRVTVTVSWGEEVTASASGDHEGSVIGATPS